jgi:predicted ribosomally synthesized peptide with SipW-like signal peptide
MLDEEPDVTRKTAAGRPTTAVRIVGSLAVLATAASVAGLGTYGNFTDSTSASTSVQTGTLSIDVSAPGGLPNTIPVSTTGFVPGDWMTRPLNLGNTGNLPLSSIRLATTATPPSVLTDPFKGLQLTLEQCSRRWTEDASGAVPTYTCDQTRRTLYSGPFVSTAALPAPDSLTPGGIDNLLFTISLPSTTGNEVQGLSASLNLAFTGVQALGGAR